MALFWKIASSFLDPDARERVVFVPDNEAEKRKFLETAIGTLEKLEPCIFSVSDKSKKCFDWKQYIDQDPLIA
jgi:hypothetical protein